MKRIIMIGLPVITILIYLSLKYCTTKHHGHDDERYDEDVIYLNDISSEDELNGLESNLKSRVNLVRAEMTELTGTKVDELHHLDQGTVQAPLVLFTQLNAFGTNKPLISMMSDYGMLKSRKSDFNKAGLPVGMSISRGSRIALTSVNCAICHTGEIRVDNKKYRVLGITSMIEWAEWAKLVDKSINDTMNNPDKAIDFLIRSIKSGDLYRDGLLPNGNFKTFNGVIAKSTLSNYSDMLERKNLDLSDIMELKNKDEKLNQIQERTRDYAAVEALRKSVKLMNSGDDANPIEFDINKEAQQEYVKQLEMAQKNYSSLEINELLEKANNSGFDFNEDQRNMPNLPRLPSDNSTPLPGTTKYSQLLESKIASEGWNLAYDAKMQYTFQLQFQPKVNPHLLGLNKNLLLPKPQISILEAEYSHLKKILDHYESYNKAVVLAAKKLPDYGPGRMDPWATICYYIIGNKTFEELEPHAGIKIPSLFAYANHEKVGEKEPFLFHFDGHTTSLLGRNLVQGMGIGGMKLTEYYNLAGEEVTGVKSTSLDLHAVNAADKAYARISTPKFPGKIDKKLAAQGKVIFYSQVYTTEGEKVSCYDCHGKKVQGREVDIDEIGTDRGRWALFNSSSDKIAMFTEMTNLADEYKEGTKRRMRLQSDVPQVFTGYEVEQPVWRPKAKGYVAKPLVGVWVSAPYLHNGSVRTLRDLLRQPKDRENSFHVGTREYDLVEVGYADKKKELESTSKLRSYKMINDKNQNKGHIYGTELDEDEKKALLEYLKTL